MGDKHVDKLLRGVGHDKTEGRALLAGTIAPSASNEVCPDSQPLLVRARLMLHPKLLRCRTDARKVPPSGTWRWLVPVAPRSTRRLVMATRTEFRAEEVAFGKAQAAGGQTVELELRVLLTPATVWSHHAGCRAPARSRVDDRNFRQAAPPEHQLRV